MRLRDFRALTFDCYGTLIDWESGLSAALEPLKQAAGRAASAEEVLAQFAMLESGEQAAHPGMRYPQVLEQVHRRLAKEWGVAVPDAMHEAFGRSVLDWPAFPDSAAALQYLKRHYRLVILSNVDRRSFAGSNAQLGVAFDAICTAEDIGSYKPDERNFRYLIATVRTLGIEPQHILHTAQSLFHDHAPAQAMGLRSAWIDRRRGVAGSGATRQVQNTPHYDFRFESLAALVEAHRAESAG